MQLNMWTYADLISHAIDYSGAATDQTTERFARRAAQLAMNALWNDRNWVYFMQRGRIVTSPRYSTGQVTYTATSGAISRQIDLVGGVFPSWASNGTLAIGNIPYDLFSRVSDTRAQMASASDPGADFAATDYTLFQDTYTLPVDFGAMGELINVGYARLMQFVAPDELLKMQRVQISPAAPYAYTTQGDPRRYGALAIRFYPPPDFAYTMDFVYRRSPRQMDTIGYDTGTVSITNGSTAMTGTGTAWTSSMVGAIIRLAATGDTNVPTGVSGANPTVMERAVAAYVSPTALTLDSAVTSTFASVKHCISDPVDIEAGAMLEYLLRSVERQVRILRRMKSTQDEERQYKEAQIMAYEADARHFASRYAFSSSLFPVRMAQMPAGADVT